MHGSRSVTDEPAIDDWIPVHDGAGHEHHSIPRHCGWGCIVNVVHLKSQENHENYKNSMIFHFWVQVEKLPARINKQMVAGVFDVIFTTVNFPTYTLHEYY